MIELTVTSSKPTMGMTSLADAMFISVALASGECDEAADSEVC